MRESFSRSVMLLAIAALAPLDDERLERAKPRPEPEPVGLPEPAATVPS